MRPFLALTLLFLLAAAPAAAQSGVERAAAALASDRVYVDPDAELAGQVDAAALRARVGAAPIFVAVLPERAVEGSPGRTLIALREAVGRKGTYALAAGSEFRTLSDAFDAAAPGDAARAEHPDDLQAALAAFIDQVPRKPPDSGGGTGAVLTILLLLAVIVGGVLLVAGRRRERSRRAERAERASERASGSFVRLGDAIRALELEVTLTENSPARADYDRAVAAYARANDAPDPEAANRALDEGLAAIAAARERLAGRR